jgi:hypothetical protein
MHERTYVYPTTVRLDPEPANTASSSSRVFNSLSRVVAAASAYWRVVESFKSAPRLRTDLCPVGTARMSTASWSRGYVHDYA